MSEFWAWWGPWLSGAFFGFAFGWALGQRSARLAAQAALAIVERLSHALQQQAATKFDLTGEEHQ